MLEQQQYEPKNDTGERPMIARSTIVPGPTESQKLDLTGLNPLKDHVVEFLSGPLVYSIVPDSSHIPKRDLSSPLEIYYLEDTGTYWIRCCSSCIPHQNKPEVLQKLSEQGITKDNSEFSDTSCIDCIEEMIGGYQHNTAKSVEDVQK
ncbi:hypothetical protein ACFL3T_03320 [Patescibacteria group bacterium]